MALAFHKEPSQQTSQNLLSPATVSYKFTPQDFDKAIQITLQVPQQSYPPEPVTEMMQTGHESDASFAIFQHPGLDLQAHMYNQYVVPQFNPSQLANTTNSATASRHNRKLRQAAKQSTQKRKAEASDEEGSESEDDGYPPVPGQSSAVQIARQKYNHIEDEKERKRLKRLLRNRVSAQQARERKKAYMSTLEVKSKELEDRSKELEQRVNTLERENFMLRQVIKNITQSNGTKAEES